jgi:hypothetical protein
MKISRQGYHSGVHVTIMDSAIADKFPGVLIFTVLHFRNSIVMIQLAMVAGYSITRKTNPMHGKPYAGGRQARFFYYRQPGSIYRQRKTPPARGFSNNNQ